MNRSIQLIFTLLLLSAFIALQTGCTPTEEVAEEMEETPETTPGGVPYEDAVAMGLSTDEADTDDDDLSDAEELYEYQTDPLVVDTDNDGLSDGDEVLVYGTDPLDPDTDGDGLSDGDEVLVYRTDPLDADSDDDGLYDYEEIYIYGTDPNNPDTDGDGFTDGEEIAMGTDPLDPEDPPVIADLNTIHFAFDRSNIDDEAARALTANIERLRDAPDFELRVDAYTDHVGGDQYNLRLSQRRAASVRDFYVNNGISEDRIETRGLGKAPTPCAQEDPDGRGCRENRRAESIPINPYRFDPADR